jgi:DNA-binding NarL/FixJ family response regulator
MAASKRYVPADQKELFPTGIRQILIVDDHELLRNGLRMLLASESDFRICGEAGDLATARKLFRQLRPDMVVVDLKLPDGNGLDFIKFAKKALPRTRVLVCSMHEEKVYGERVLRAGASGYVNKQDAADLILNAMRHVLAGKLHFSEDLVNRVMMRAISNFGNVEQSPIETMSDRELEVFRMVGQGLTTREIAKRLHLSPSTVDTYRERLKTKLGVKTATELIHRASQWTLETASI